MPNEEISHNGHASEALADITDQTLAEESPEEIPTVDGDEALLGDDPAALRARLEEMTRRAEAEHEAFLRARADFANYKRRTDEERERLRAIISEDLIQRVLPIVDNFERALQSAGATRDYDKLVEGVEAILRQVQEFLAREGVAAIDAVGQPFDPNYHDAVLRDETADYPENTVVEELQKGYTLGERVLRPSMVKVATGAG
jgi:molecular chaperone GrpE